MNRAYAPIELRCPTCDAVVELKIPVDFEIVEDQDGDSVIRAMVNQSEEYVEPLWRHSFDEHGPRP